MAPRRRGLRRGGPPFARDGGRVADLDRADSVTVDPHKWFFQAYDIGGLLVRDGGAPRRGRSAAGARSTTAAASARGAAAVADDDHDERRRPAQLLQARLRGHAPLAGAEALDVVEAPRHDRLRPARSRRTSTWPPTWPRAAPRPTTSKRSRPSRSFGRVLPPPARRPRAPRSDAARASSTPTRTDCRRRSRRRATAGSRRRASAARPTCAPGS